MNEVMRLDAIDDLSLQIMVRLGERLDVSLMRKIDNEVYNLYAHDDDERVETVAKAVSLLRELSKAGSGRKRETEDR